MIRICCWDPFEEEGSLLDRDVFYSELHIRAYVADGGRLEAVAGVVRKGERCPWEDVYESFKRAFVSVVHDVLVPFV